MALCSLQILIASFLEKVGEIARSVAFIICLFTGNHCIGSYTKRGSILDDGTRNSPFSDQLK